MDEYSIEFNASIEPHDFGRMAYTVVYAPAKIVRGVGLKHTPRLRIDGLVAGQPFHGAFQPAGDGRFYQILSKKFLKSSRLKLGDKVAVSFDIADQDAVEVPKPLEFALAANDQARKVWDTITPGKKRSFAYRVSSAKRAETIENRVEEVIEQLLAMQDFKR